MKHGARSKIDVLEREGGNGVVPRSARQPFTIWLAGRPGYRSQISYADADYFNVSANDERFAKACGRGRCRRLMTSAWL
jgi:hypothetical protein